MSLATRTLVERHWHSANERDWTTFATVLGTDLLYRVPQTREQVRGRANYVEFFSTWPGPWRAEIRRLIADETSATTVIDFVTADATMTGIAVFDIEGGVITAITDYWPEPYEPPPRATAVVERY